MYRAKTQPDDVLSRLPGRQHLVVGNHDYTWLSRVDIDKYFVEVEDIIILKTGMFTMTLCHYPMLSWPHSFYGSYMWYTVTYITQCRTRMAGDISGLGREC